jgi:hypothetical protein
LSGVHAGQAFGGAADGFAVVIFAMMMIRFFYLP